MLKKLWRSRFVQVALGNVLALYLRLVKCTSKEIIAPGEYERARALGPCIVAMWHGQHFLIPFALQPGIVINVLISRHGDGELNAIAAQKFGIGLVRGSGAQRSDQIRKRGGTEALRAMLAVLKSGQFMALTADVPKISRVAGEGIIALARLSGRPILPMAVVMDRRVDFPSWDCASIGLPFGRYAITFGEPVYVASDADDATLEAARQAVEIGLDAVHRRAYTEIGDHDPGADRPSVAAARQAAANRQTARFEPEENGTFA